MRVNKLDPAESVRAKTALHSRTRQVFFSFAPVYLFIYFIYLDAWHTSSASPKVPPKPKDFRENVLTIFPISVTS